MPTQHGAVLVDDAAQGPDSPETSTEPAARVVPWGGLAWALVAVATAVRAWAGAAGWFYWDDFILIGRSGRLPTVSAELLLHDHDGHLMPGGYAVTAWLTGIAPFDFGAALTLLLLLQLVASVSVLVMLRTISGGHGPAVVAGLALYLFSPMTLPSFVWWAAAVNALPLQIALAWAIWAAVRLDSRPARLPLIVGVLALVAGLVFFEKAVLVPFAAAGVVLVLRTYRQGARSALPSAWATQRVLWGAWLLVLAAHQLLYRVVTDGRSAAGDAVVAGEMLVRGLVGTVVPTLVGGPLHWTSPSPAAILADPPAWLVAGSVLGVACVLVVSVRRVPRSGWAWLLGFGYVLADLVLLALGRAAPGVEAAIAQSQRYTADAAVVLAAVVVLVARAQALGAPARTPTAAPAQSLPAPPGPKWALLITAAAVVAGWLWSTATFVALWRESPARSYVRVAVAELGDHIRDPMLDQPVPQNVLYGLATPYDRVSWFFSPVDRRPPVVGSVAALRGLDGSGRFGDQTLDVVRRGPSEVGYCAQPVGPDALDIQLDGPLIGWDWTISVPYSASRPTELDIALGEGSTQRVDLQVGGHVVFARVTGSGDVVHVRPVHPREGACLGQVEVGLVAAP